VLLIAAMLLWLGAAFREGVILQFASGETGWGHCDVDGRRIPIVIAWRRGGSTMPPAWSEFSIELPPNIRNLDAGAPLNDVAIQRNGEFKYTFQRPDGTTYGPVTIDFDRHLAGLVAEFESAGMSFVDRAPGFEFSWRGVASSMAPYVLRFALVSVIAIVLITLFTSERVWHRRREHECPKCGYDLRGDTASGCPECGWGRTEVEPEPSR